MAMFSVCGGQYVDDVSKLTSPPTIKIKILASSILQSSKIPEDFSGGDPNVFRMTLFLLNGF